MLRIMKAFTVTCSTKSYVMRRWASSPMAPGARLHGPALNLLTAILMIDCPIDLSGLLQLLWDRSFENLRINRTIALEVRGPRALVS